MNRNNWSVATVVVVTCILNASRANAGCTITWDGGAGTSAWNTGSNWSTNIVPGPADDVCIPASATVIFNTGTVTVNSLTCDGTFTIAGGTLTLTSASQINGPFTLSNGTLSGAGSLTITDDFNWTAGTMSGAGATIIDSAATMSVSGPSGKGLARTLNNFGSASWSGGQFQVTNGTFNNKLGATLDITGTISMSGSVGTNAFNNEGLVTRSGAGSTNFFSNAATMAFNNLSTGEVQVSGGTLMITKGGTSDGNINVAAAGTLLLNSALTYGGTSTLEGDGSVTFATGTHTFPAGTFAFAGAVTVGGGTATINDTFSLSSVTVTGGTLNASGGPSTIATLAISNGTLGGSAEVTVADSFNWTGGTMAGSGTTIIPSKTTFTISGVNGKGLARTLDNFTNVVWNDGQFALNNGTFNNKFGATFTMIASSFSGQTGTNAFNNEGTCIKSGGGMTDFFSNAATMTFNNLSAGVVNVTGGTLKLSKGGSNDGLIAISSGATLELFATVAYGAASSVQGSGTISFAGGTHNFPAGTFAITGTVLVSGASPATINDPLSLASISISGGTLNASGGPSTANTLALSGGTLGGSAELTITSSVNWTGGTMAGSGITIIPASATLTMSGTNGKGISRIVNNFGAATWSDGQLSFNTGTFNNKPGATFSMADSVMSGQTGTNAFNNEGTCTKSTAALTQIFSNAATMAFNNSGAVNILNGTLSVSSVYTQTAGSAILNGGSFTKLNSAVALQGGILGGVGTLTGAVSSTGGVVAPGLSPGLLTITGDLTRSSGSTLDVELGGAAPGIQHDRLNVSGTATLAGTLRLTFVNGFTPHHGDTFTILTAGSRIGTFSAVDVVGYPDCVATVTYTATSAIVQVDSIAPTANCHDINVFLDASGQAAITPAQIDNGSADNCSIQTYELDISSFDCSDLGPNAVQLKVTDLVGNQSTCNATVTVIDNTPPIISCKNITIAVNDSGNATITPAQVFQSGTDNCGIINLDSVAPNTFTCSNLGANSVTLTVNDGHGNHSTCQATVTVQDNTPPTVSCQNITVSLDAAGHASITPAQLHSSSSDNCGTVNLVSVAPNSFTCANLGANPVTLTVNDGHGNQATCNATVTVQDTTPPIISCQNIEITLDRAGQITISPAQVFSSGSDNCGTVNLLSVVPDSFSCKNIGSNQVTLTVDDGHGNQSTCQATVTITPTGRYQGPPNGSWFDGSNWCAGSPPDSELDVSLDVAVNVDQFGGVARNINILSGGELIIGGVGGPATLAASQSLTVESGGTLTIHANGALVVHDLIVASGATLDWIGGSITIDSGAWTNPPATAITIGCGGDQASLILANGASVYADTINICSLGELRGNGSIVADVANAGTLRPGSSAGMLSISGDYTQSATGTLAIELGGLVAGGESDLLIVSGSASLDGALQLALINNFTPTFNDSIEILEAALRNGTFAQVIGSPGVCNTIFLPQYDDSTVVIETTYEPQLRDCNLNAIPDDCDLLAGLSLDCNANSIPDECDTAEGGTSFDCNANSIPDECDLSSRTSFDCNLNGVLDECDIASGVSVDLNLNTIPDDCEVCIEGDITCNGVVDVDDLLYLVNNWGLCDPAPLACPGDVFPIGEGNGVVDVDDLLVLINNWT